MLSQSPSKIYKAQFRGHEEDENYRCLSTLNFGNYFDATRKPFGRLKVLNEETLAPQKTKSFSIENNETLVILPLVGTVDYTDDSGNENYIKTETLQIVSASRLTAFQIRNPYETELINYLQIRFEHCGQNPNLFEAGSFGFNLKNELFPLLEHKDFSISIGIFSLRSESTYYLKKNGGVFAFVINGAFEFQNRLLETRDSLALWEHSEIEFEALSENAILLVIETTL